MNKRTRIRKPLSLILSLFLLAGCTDGFKPPVESTESQETVTETDEEINEAFENDMDILFEKICLSNYELIHILFENPEDYGLNPSEAVVSLGDFIPTTEDLQLDQDVLDTLAKYDNDLLNEENQLIYEQLEWQYTLDQQIQDPKFNYLDQVWTNHQGLPQIVESFFANYFLYQEKDIPYLLEYFYDLPGFMEKARDYTDKQAEKGWLAYDLEYMISYIDEILNAPEDEGSKAAIFDQIDDLNLDDSIAQHYKDEVQQAYDEMYLPAFSEMKEILLEHEKDNQPIQGMSAYPNGEEYYKLILEYNAGAELDIDDTIDYVINAYNETLMELLSRVKSDAELNQLYDLKSGLNDIDEIIDYLQSNYTRLFPAVGEVKIDIEPMTELESQDSSSRAYTAIRPIDYQGSYPIYYNKDFEEGFDTLDFYTTLAHESLPGHIYQEAYQKEHPTQKIEYLFNTFGYSESWANYASKCALEWLNISSNSIYLYQLLERFEGYSSLWLDLDINYNSISVEEFEVKYGYSADQYYLFAQSPGLFFAYYYGAEQLNNWKEALKEKLGSRFDWKEYNSRIISAGEINFSLLKDQLEKEYGISF